ncbi:MAG: GAF domain-containing protein [Bacteroidota bacterium]
MSEDLRIPASNLSRHQRYQELIPQVQALVVGESDLIANLANIAAALHETFRFLWVGFYLVQQDTLVLGPFQGPVACTRIAKGKGVCGTAWMERRNILVPDVEQFPGHIACSSLSRSEIVLPAFRDGEVFLVLDVDSEELNHFSEEDEKGLQEIIRIIEQL